MKLFKQLLILVGVVSFWGIAYADLTTTPTSIQAGDQTVLHSYITGTATSITLEPVIKYINAVKTKGCVNSSGGFAVLQDTSRTEWISFSSTSCSSTFITTLTGVRRGLSPTAVTFTAGTGMSWDAGTTFKVIDYPIVFNNALYIDRNAAMTGSGAVRCTATNQPCLFAGGFTQTQVNAFSYGTSSGLYPEIFNTTTGVRQYWNGSAWINYGSGSTVNASDTVAGKVQIISLSDLQSRTATGSTGAQDVLSARWVVKNGTGTVTAGRIPQLNQNGVISATLGGNGTGGTLGIASGSILLFQRGSAPRPIYPSAANQAITTTDGVNWKAATLDGGIVSSAYNSGPTPAFSGSSSGSLMGRLTIAANTLVVGRTYEIIASGTGTTDNTAALSMKLWFGSGTVAGGNANGINIRPDTSAATNTKATWSTRVRVTVLSTGATGKFLFWATSVGLSNLTPIEYAPNNNNALPVINTTISNTLEIKVAENAGVGNLTSAVFVIRQYN